MKRVAWLDLSDVQHRFVTGAGATASTRVRGRASLEYRRFLLLRLAYRELDNHAPPLIESYWRVHAADQSRFASDCASLTQGTGVSPDELVPPARPSDRSAGPEIRERYESTFPCGSADLWGWPLPAGYRHSAPALSDLHVRLPSAIDEPTRTLLREEAFEQRQQAEQAHPTGSAADTLRCVDNGGRYWYSDHGPVLGNLHWGSAIPRLIAEQTGVIVAPSTASYLYYGPGGFIRIHTDQYCNELTLLTLLSGSVGQLELHLHLADTPFDEIQKIAAATNGLPAGGTPFEINTVPFLLSGQRIPHHRAPRDREDETVIVVQNFAVLLPWHPADPQT